MECEAGWCALSRKASEESHLAGKSRLGTVALQLGGLYNCPCHQWDDLLAFLWHIHFAKHFVWQALMLTNPWSQSVHKNRQLIPQKCQRMGFIRLTPIVSSLLVDRSHIPIFNPTPFLISRLRRLTASGLPYRERLHSCHPQHVKNRTYHLLSITSLSPPLPKMWLHQCPISEFTDLAH